MLLRAKRRLGGAFGRGRYTHKRRKVTLDAGTCDALGKAIDLAVELRQRYI